LILVSRLKPAATNALREATLWHRDLYQDQSARLAAFPVWQDYRYLAAALLALTALLVIAFR
jgi:hypothetical protein